MPAGPLTPPATIPDMDRRTSERPAVGWFAAALAVVARPTLWPTALGLMFRLAPRGWWRRPPFLPRPDRAYLEFRMVTAFGPEHGSPPAAELVSYLRWLRAWPEVVAR
jgi:hypothetical protein